MAKSAKSGNTAVPQQNVRNTWEQTAFAARPIFGQADDAFVSQEKVNHRWQSYAADVVVPNHGNELTHGEPADIQRAINSFRRAFNVAFICERGVNISAKEEDRAEAYRTYSLRNNQGKKEHEHGVEIAKLLNRAGVYFARVLDTVRKLMDPSKVQRTGKKSALESWKDKVEKLDGATEKLVAKETLGMEANKHVSLLRQALAWLKTHSLTE